MTDATYSSIFEGSEPDNTEEGIKSGLEYLANMAKEKRFIQKNGKIVIGFGSAYSRRWDEMAKADGRFFVMDRVKK